MVVRKRKHPLLPEDWDGFETQTPTPARKRKPASKPVQQLVTLAMLSAGDRDNIARTYVTERFNDDQIIIDGFYIQHSDLLWCAHRALNVDPKRYTGIDARLLEDLERRINEYAPTFYLLQVQTAPTQLLHMLMDNKRRISELESKLQDQDRDRRELERQIDSLRDDVRSIERNTPEARS